MKKIFLIIYILFLIVINKTIFSMQSPGSGMLQEELKQRDVSIQGQKSSDDETPIQDEIGMGVSEEMQDIEPEMMEQPMDFPQESMGVPGAIPPPEEMQDIKPEMMEQPMDFPQESMGVPGAIPPPEEIEGVEPRPAGVTPLPTAPPLKPVGPPAPPVEFEQAKWPQAVELKEEGQALVSEKFYGNIEEYINQLKEINDEINQHINKIIELRNEMWDKFERVDQKLDLFFQEAGFTKGKKSKQRLFYQEKE
ncbi:hypothetical protein GF322_01225 [Candidatus Dependentiae bacterium]|nr:hypothetical protein [Candidatus Dependentiae bacterium]